MNSSIGYIFAIVFIVIALNLFFVVSRMRQGDKRRNKRNRVAPDEAKQALWRDREIERRLEREQDGANERVKLREETLALYDEVRRRHAEKDRLEGLGFSADGSGSLGSGSYGQGAGYETAGYEQAGFDASGSESVGLEGAGLESIRLENPELHSYLADSEPFGSEFVAGASADSELTVSEPVVDDSDIKVDMIGWDSYNADDSDDDLDPFDIFKRKK